MSVLNEGRVKKRKHQKADRCHREDEKERRKDITTEFEKLKAILPKVKKSRTRQEILSCTRELIWVGTVAFKLFLSTVIVKS